LSWDVENFNGLNTIYIEKNKLWTPDITLYNKYDRLSRYNFYWVFPITELSAVAPEA